MALSGAAALAWQFLWTQQLGVRLGHEMVSVLAVMAAFFGDLSLGSWAFSRALANSRWPGRWYAVCEVVVLLWGLVLYLALPMVMDWAVHLMGSEPSAMRHWGIAFAFPLVALLPATVAMGVTLPAVELQLDADASPWAGIYAVNTLGAVTGLLLFVFYLVPQFGLGQTGLLCCAVNALCAGAAWALWGAKPVAGTGQAGACGAGRRPASANRPGRVLALLFLTGLLGIGYQVLAVRVLSLVTENTVFSYALILAVYLLGTSCGAAIYHWKTVQGGDAQLLLRWLITALATAVLLSGFSLWWADAWCALPARWWGHTAFTALAGEALAAVATLLAPTMVMGALFTHLCLQAKSAGWAMGQALAVNTAGAALAPLLVGVWLLPTWGAAAGLLVLVAGYLAIQPRTSVRGATRWVVAVSALAWGVFAGPLRFVDIPDGGRLVSYRDGVMAAVSVVEDASGIAHLHINNRVQEGSSAGSPVESRLALLPLMFQSSGGRALFLGLGTGFTSRVAAGDAAQQVEAVELLPEVVQAADYFQSRSGVRPDRPVHVVTADARRFVQAGTGQYDLIVADLFHPARNGAGSLYTVEQFTAVRRLLAPQGIFCQWLAVHQMELDTLRSIVAAFLRVYPQGIAVLASNSLDSPVLGLLARPGQALFDADTVQTRISHFAKPQALRDARLVDPYAVLGSVVADSNALARFAQGQAANTDDRPLVTHNAPWAAYAAQTTPRMRLLSLLEAFDASAPQVLRQATPALEQRFSAYWHARNRYIQLGSAITPSASPQKMLDQLQGPLLALLRASPDFRPALDALLSLSSAIASSDPGRAREILAALQLLYPQDGQIAQATSSLR
jgi:spermidine synthase